MLLLFNFNALCLVSGCQMSQTLVIVQKSITAITTRLEVMRAGSAVKFA